MGKDWPVICTTKLGKNGGNRCEKQNDIADGADRSRHLKRDASDIYVPNMTPKELARLAEQIGPVMGKPGTVDGFGGIGVGNYIVHVDSRPRKPSGRRALWVYGAIQFDWAK
jgi:uncharacterized protein YcbK (DUF882 family)